MHEEELGMASDQKRSHWTDALMVHPLFEHLTEHSCRPGEDVLSMCESRGDIFVWDPPCQVILTTNLKRLHASTTTRPNESIDIDRQEIDQFQYLTPTIFPATSPLSLIPSNNGRHIALVGSQYVYVIELWRQRGPQGEFSGGVSDVDCRTISIGDTLMRAHRLHTVQVKWHHDDNSIIAILTIDGALRLYKLSEPSVPFITMSVSIPHPQYSRTISLDQQNVVTAFNFMSNDSIALLQNCMDIQTILIKNGEQPTSPLPMFPIDKDNYGDTASTLLVIPSCPPVIVMATTSGRLLHSVYMDPEESDNDDNQIIGGGLITVIENIQLDYNEPVIHLLSDSSINHCYCVYTPTDIYIIELPWIQHLEQFLFDGVQFCANPPAIVKHLLHSSDKSISDCVLLVDSVLGCSIIAIIDDRSCVTVPFELHSANISHTITGSNQTIPTNNITLSNTFATHICDLLISPKDNSSLPKKTVRFDGVTTKSQEQCFQFLQESLITLRQQYIAPQHIATAKLNGRIQLLVKRKDRQINDILKLEENCEDIKESSTALERKSLFLNQACKEKIDKVEKLLSIISSSSPVMSEAEKLFAKDLILIKEQLEELTMLLTKAKSKVSFGIQSQSWKGRMTLNESKMDTILTSLTDDGTAIKNSIKVIKSLATNLDVDISN